MFMHSTWLKTLRINHYQKIEETTKITDLSKEYLSVKYRFFNYNCIEYKFFEHFNVYIYVYI